MGYISLLLIVTILFFGAAYGGFNVDFNVGLKVPTKLAGLCFCPIPGLSAPDETLCCAEGCCNVLQFLFSGYRLIIIIVVAVAVAFISLMCCLRAILSRRNQGVTHIVPMSPVYHGQPIHHGSN